MVVDSYGRERDRDRDRDRDRSDRDSRDSRRRSRSHSSSRRSNKGTSGSSSRKRRHRSHSNSRSRSRDRGHRRRSSYDKRRSRSKSRSFDRSSADGGRGGGGVASSSSYRLSNALGGGGAGGAPMMDIPTAAGGGGGGGMQGAGSGTLQQYGGGGGGGSYNNMGSTQAPASTTGAAHSSHAAAIAAAAMIARGGSMRNQASAAAAAAVANPLMNNTLGGLQPAMQMMAGGMQMPLADAPDKVFRELFVGNTPPNTSEFVLMQFLNAALNQVKLVTGPGDPIINCRVNNKFAFIEFRSRQETDLALSLNGIPFCGAMLKIGRPSKYVGPLVPASTWQALTGQQTDPAIVDPSTKLYREIYVGNLNETISADLLREFINTTMKQVGFVKDPNITPILSCRSSGNFAFVECRTMEEATNMLNLNNIPFMGINLRVNRPSKFPGPPTAHLNWEDVLAKYIAGELTITGGPNDMNAAAIANAQAATAREQAAAAAAAAAAGIKPVTSRVLRLSSMVTSEDLAEEDELGSIEEEAKEECEKYGVVIRVHIPRPSTTVEVEKPGVGYVFVEFGDEFGSAKACQNLQGRTFDGRTVEATYWKETAMQSKDFTDAGRADAPTVMVPASVTVATATPVMMGGSLGAPAAAPALVSAIGMTPVTIATQPPSAVPSAVTDEAVAVAVTAPAAAAPVAVEPVTIPAGAPAVEDDEGADDMDEVVSAADDGDAANVDETAGGGGGGSGGDTLDEEAGGDGGGDGAAVDAEGEAAGDADAVEE